MSSHNAYPAQPEQTFGPTPEDIAGYSQMLQVLDGMPDGVRPTNILGYEPRVLAEQVFQRLDYDSEIVVDGTVVGHERVVGTFVDMGLEASDLGERDTTRIAMQRFSAAAMGMKVGELQVNPRTGIAKSEVSLPGLEELPPRPTRAADGTYVTEDGRKISQTQADAIHSAHFIANNAAVFSQPGAFEKNARKVVAQAEQGYLEVADKVGDPYGAMAFTRQMAKLMGYQVTGFTVMDGKYRAEVTGVRKGYEIQTSDYRQGLPAPLGGIVDLFPVDPGTK